MHTEDVHAWIDTELPKHRRLTPVVQSLLENILRSRSIAFLTVNGRPKDKQSALEKFQRKSYNDPKSQMTDLTGIRVITFLDSQVRQICEVVREVFEIDDKNSLDKSAILGNDKIGYRSVHFVCTLGAARAGLREYDTLTDLKFEIQVRTVLQHAWAELAHNRSYKFGMTLPEPIQRKLNLYAGMLEIIDDSVDNISKEIDIYTSSLETASKDDLLDQAINSISLAVFLDKLRRESGIPSSENEQDGTDKSDELETLRELAA